MKSVMKEALKSARFIMVFGIISRILTLLKETLIASKIGCCSETDAYFTAFVAATLLAEIIGEGIATGLIPIMLKIEEKEGSEKGVDYVNYLLHIVTAFSLFLVLLGWFLAPIVIKFLALGFTGEKLKITMNLMKIGLPMMIFITVRGIFIAYLQSHHAFRAGSKSLIYYNVTYIIFLTFFSRYGITGLMITGIIASGLQLLSVIPAAFRLGYRYKGVVKYENVHVKEFLIMFMPIVIGISINRANMVVDKSIASTLSTGSISWLNYANDIIQLILGISISAIITVAFPIIAQEYSRDNISGLKGAMLRVTRIILSIAIPATVILITLSQPIVRLLFQRGEFDARATLMTAGALVYYALGLATMAMVLILTRIHYAMHDSLGPMISALIGVVTNLLLSLILSRQMGTNGIALATSISTSLVFILLIRDLNRKMKVIDFHDKAKDIFKFILIVIIMAMVTLFAYDLTGKIRVLGEASRLLISLIAGLATYTLAIARLLRI